MTTAAIRRAGLALFTAFSVVGLFASTGEAQDKQAKADKQDKPAKETVKGFEAESGQVIVRFDDAPSSDLVDFLTTALDADEFRKLGGGRNHLWKIHSRTLDVPSLLDALSGYAEIDYVEPNYSMHLSAAPNDASFSSQWAFQNLGQTVNGKAGSTGSDVGAVAAWNVTKGSVANVVAVVDTGVDYTHTDLSANIWSAPSSYTVTMAGTTVTCASGTHGYNALTNLCTPVDDVGHGTHVAGIIGAIGNNSLGVTGINQVARILPIKTFDANGNGSTADAIEGIEYAVQLKQFFAASNGANIRAINASWGGAPFTQALLDAINDAYANNILFVAAAGNSGTDNDDEPLYPASYNSPNVIAVAATDSTDYLPAYSNYGSQSVDLAAPGDNIYSTIPNGGYMFASGTSMAAPMVSGTAALVLSVCKTLDTAALKNDILSTVTPLGSLAGKVATQGRLNADAAVRACAPPPAPLTPTGVTAVAGNAKITLSWTAAAGATSYNLKMSMSSRGPWTTAATSTGVSGVVSGLTNGTYYYFVVSAVNAGGESANSSYVKPRPVAPAGPSGLAATAGQWSASLTWTAVSNASGYNVKRATSSGGPWTTIATVTDPGYTATQLTGGTLYYFVVSYLYADGESLNSSYVSTRPTAPAGPTGLVATAGNAKVSLAWTASSQASSYNVKFATSSTGPWTTAGNTTATGFVVTGLANAKLYYFVVSFMTPNGESLNSTYVSAMPTAPAGPTGLVATAGQWTVALTWTASANAVSYNVKRSTSSTGPWTLVGTTTSTTYSLTQLTGNTTYYFVVSYNYSDGESNNSSYVSAKPTAPAGPTGLAAVAGDQSAALTWSASIGATGYNVKRATSTSGPWTTVATVSTNAATVTGLANGTLYYFEVSFLTPDGESLNSTYVGAKPLAPPATPAGVSAAGQAGQVYLSWGSTSGASGFYVKRGTSASGPFTQVGPTTSRSYYDKGQTQGSSPCYVVSAYNVNGTEGAASVPVCATVQ